MFMPSSAKNGLIDFVKSNFEDDVEFSQVVKDGRRILKIEVEYQTEQWDWTADLDDAGIFIFRYLLFDYKKKILSLKRLKESVYTLNILRQKMIPSHEKKELPLLEEFQVIFTLYEKLKHEKMSWKECEEYVMEQISAHLSNH
tara:strand:+ start:40 stop:468 length:429 start_codon:yes stop_codon:yes gene_type:complete